jgi:hypothetical protein
MSAEPLSQQPAERAHRRRRDKCDHLAFRTKEVDWQIWTAQGARPYPCRYVITSKKVTGWPQYTLDIWAWKTGAEVASDGFKLDIPIGAKKLTPEQVPELNVSTIAA